MLEHCGTQTLHTERLILRPFQYSDAEDMLVNWIADPDIQSLLSEPVYTTREEVGGLLDRWVGSYERTDYYRWAIVEKSTPVCIGQIAIFLVDNKNHFCEIEYGIGSRFHRKGYASEAVREVLDFAFGRVCFHKVQVCHKEGNVASQGIIRKNNFTYEGTLRDYFFMNGRYVNRYYYSMLREEYDERRM